MSKDHVWSRWKRFAIIWMPVYLVVSTAVTVLARFIGISPDDGWKHIVVMLMAIIVGWKAGADTERWYVQRASNHE